MMVRQILAAALAGASLLAWHGVSIAQPATVACTAAFARSDGLGAFASADITNGGLDRLYIEMGPVRTPMSMRGTGVSGAYTTTASDLMIWNIMSVYQPPKEWLTPGGVRFDYSGFRIGWPAFSASGKAVPSLKLTVTQGTQSIIADVGAAQNRVFAIDFAAMLPGPHPVQEVGDDDAWRNMADAGHPFSVTLTDAATGKVVAHGEASGIPADMQSLLSGGMNALRDKFKAGECK